MEYEPGTYYRAVRPIYVGSEDTEPPGAIRIIPPGAILRMSEVKWRSGAHGRAGYALLHWENVIYYVPVSRKNVGPDGFVKATALEVLGDCAE